MQTSFSADIKGMQLHKRASFLKRNARSILLLLFFVPFSINEITANYSFAALFFLSKFKAVRNIPFSVLAYIGFIFLSYLYGFFIISQFDPHHITRASLSFYSYLLFVLLLVIKTDYSTEQICKAVLWLSVAYSLYVIVNIAFRPEFALSNPYYIKGYMRQYVWDWPQRFPILVCFSVFYCLKLLQAKKVYLLFLMLLLACLFLTFTRSVYLALLCGGFCYIIINFANLVNLKKRYLAIRRSKIKVFLLVIGFVVILIPCLTYFDQSGSVKMIFERAETSISSFLTGHEIMEGSDSERIKYWSNILDVVGSSPLFGSGFGNIYLFESSIGSAHSQYMDMLIRTGYIGLVFYLFFWVKALYFYLKNDVYIFCGLISIFAYGCFHETTKLTYVGVLFFLLLNKSFTGNRRRSIHNGGKST